MKIEKRVIVYLGLLLFAVSCSREKLKEIKEKQGEVEPSEQKFLSYKYFDGPDQLISGDRIINECDLKLNSDGVYLLRAKQVNEIIEPTCSGLYSWFITKQDFELIETVWGMEVNREIEVLMFSSGSNFREGWEGVVSLSYVREEYFIAGYIEASQHDSVVENEIEGRNIIVDLPRTVDGLNNAIEEVDLRSEKCFHVQRNIESDEGLEEKFFSPMEDPNLRCGEN